MKITRNKTLSVMLHQVSGDGSLGTEMPLYDSFYMESEGHNLRDLGTGDVGGEWALYREHNTAESNSYPVQRIFGSWVGGQCRIDGIYPGAYMSTGWNDPLARISDSGLTAKGSTAISRCLPTNPYVNLGSSIAEQIGAPLPSIIGHTTWKARALTLKNSGSEYLNYSFGWLPLVSDVRKTAHAIVHSSRILKDFLAGSGKKTRTGYHFPAEVDSRSFETTLLVSSGDGGRGKTGTVFERVVNHTWFNGCFTYYVPSGDSRIEKILRAESEANKLLGLRLTPEVLWNATPWSWAADWFGNTGDVLHNLGSFANDGLVMQYGYVMETLHRRREYNIYPHVDGFFRAQRVQTEVWKRRLRATPYGFGVDLKALSGSQIAILTALGLSRGLPGRGY